MIAPASPSRTGRRREASENTLGPRQTIWSLSSWKGVLNGDPDMQVSVCRELALSSPRNRGTMVPFTRSTSSSSGRLDNASGPGSLCKGVDVTTEDATDFLALYSEVDPRLWRAILAFTGGRRDLTDDVVAEAFARTLEAGNSVRQPGAYVYRVAFRLAAQELRRPTTNEDVASRTVYQDPALVELFDALMRLSPGQRAAIYLRYEADLPVADIAHLMGTTSGTVRIHLLRGRRKLAAMLGDEGDD